LEIDPKECFPITHVQKRIWHTEKIYPGTSTWTIAFAVKYNHMLDINLLEDALNLALQKNDGLRLQMTENSENGLTVVKQYLVDFQPIRLPYFDFSTGGKEALTEWLDKEVQEPFELIDHSLYYFAAVRFNQNENGYFMKLHHIIFDGWSLFMLINEIDQIYKQLEQGLKPDATPNNTYLNYIRDEKAYLESEQFQKDRAFWLDNMLPLPAQAELFLSSYQSDNILAKRNLLPIEGALRNEIDAFFQQNNTTIFKIFMAALAVYIARVTGNRDVVIGMVNHNRGLPEHKKMIGMFVSTIPLRIQADDSLTFYELLEQIGQNMNYIIKNHGKYPFDLLAADLREATGIDPGYLLNIILDGHPDLEQSDFNLDLLLPKHDTNPMIIHIDPGSMNMNGRLEVEWGYQSARFSDEYIENMQQGMVDILRGVLSNPGEKIARRECHLQTKFCIQK